MGYPGLQERLKNDFDTEMPIAEWLDKEPELHEETLRERIRRSPSRCISVKKRWLALK